MYRYVVMLPNAPATQNFKCLILSFTFVCTEYFSSFFSKFKKHNSVKNRTWTKSKLDKRTLMTYRYIKLEVNVCNCCRNNEWKVYDDRSTEGCTMTELGNTLCLHTIT